MTPTRSVWATTGVAVLILVCLAYPMAFRRPKQLVGQPGPPQTAITLEDANRRTAVGSISGVVRSPAGKPAANARICATTLSSEIFWSPDTVCTMADSNGQYRIAQLANTAYVVSAIADGFQPESALHGASINLDQGEAKMGMDVALTSAGAKLSGRALDAFGAPVPGATIHAMRRDTPHDIVVTNSGPDGRFELWSAPGPVTILAQAKGFSSVRLLHIAPSADLVLTLTPGSTVRGRVISDRTGKPIAGVEVRALRLGGWNNPLTLFGRSNVEGVYEIEGLEPNQYTLSAVGTGQYGELRHPILVGLQSRTEELAVRMSPAAIVAGKVIRRGGNEPCARGTVSFGPESATHSTQASGLAGGKVPVLFTSIEIDGSVHFNAVPAGVYRVEIQCDDSILAEGPATLQVGDANLGGIVWKVDPAVRLVVHALNDANQVAAYAHLRLYGPTAPGADPAAALFHSSLTANADGISEVRGLSPGVYRVEAERGYDGLAISVDARGPGRVDATTHLRGRGSILVTVQTADGERVDQVSVTAVVEEQVAASPGSSRELSSKEPASSHDLSRGGSPASTLGNGRFQIGPLAPGLYRVQVNDGFNPPAQPTVPLNGLVRVRGDATRTTVVLRRSGEIRGRVSNASGEILPGVWVSAVCVPQRTGMAPSSALSREGKSGGIRLGPFGRLPSYRALSDSKGQFRVAHLDSGSVCTVRAEQPTGSVGVAKNVCPGDEITVTLPALGTLSGDAFLPDGSPASDFALSVRDPDTGARNETIVATNAGRWLLPRVVPGHLQLLASATGAVAKASLELSPGQQRDGIQLRFHTLPVQQTVH